MKILAIVGSPRRERGLSEQVVSALLEGAKAGGAQTETLYLVDEQPEPCIHCGHACFHDGTCAQDEGTTARSRQVDSADALIVCAPVYVWQPNGLTMAFFDRMRFSTGAWTRGTLHGRPGLGIAVAGGTGTGVFPAIQSVYNWLCLWKFRPVTPMPVTRFNLERMLADAPAVGQMLAESDAEPFADVAELMTIYDELPEMQYGRIDEFRWLATQLAGSLEAQGADGDDLSRVRTLLDQSQAANRRQDRQAEARFAIEAYRVGARLWRAE